MHLSVLLQFAVSTDYSTREYQSIFHGIKLHSLKYPASMLALCWHRHSTPAGVVLMLLLCWHILCRPITRIIYKCYYNCVK